MPRWFGVAAHMIADPAVFVFLPWVLSTLAVRHGWVAGKPGVLNLIGLIPVLAGACVFGWSMVVHFTSAPEGWKLERTPHYPTPGYLLARGPYRFSRNPIYLAEGFIGLGWIVFYGSLLLFAIFVVMAVLVGPFVMRREERGLEARFGETYRQYKRSTPRWL